MKIPFLALVVVAILSGCSSTSVPSAASGHSSQIVGVWMFDELASTTTHVASRTHYYPDGSFVADYRISHPGSSSCFRETGRWSFEGDLFVEESTSTTNPTGRQTPKLLRRIESASSSELLLASRTGMKAHLRRGPKLHPKGFRLSEQDLLADLAPLKMRGFIPFPIPGQPGQSGWRVECTMIESLRP